MSQSKRKDYSWRRHKARENAWEQVIIIFLYYDWLEMLHEIFKPIKSVEIIVKVIVKLSSFFFLKGITAATMKKILKEMMSLFPDQYFHLGLDEVMRSSRCTTESKDHSFALSEKETIPFNFNFFCRMNKGTNEQAPKGMNERIANVWRKERSKDRRKEWTNE